MRTYLQYASCATAGIGSAPFKKSDIKTKIHNEKECTKMKKIFSALLVLTTLLLLASCGVTEEEVITVYNASELYIDRVVIAPEENVLESSKKIILFDSRENPELRMGPSSSEDFTVDVPLGLTDSVWYISVSAAPDAFLGMYTATDDFGAMFNDGVWGVQVMFDEVEGEALILLPLDNSDI